ncbi:hypothetical protein ACJMK2_033954 [Sinanodonta woodiana]|uniref:Chitobiosyldiphosphodolichol beta-mannosyltransferase n=1 Tax=Sinanodonta woodiana TaxID=1069815 RepID=A0ABD3WUA0_SINWO
MDNPPSIPTIAVSVLVCLLRWSHLVIDWHNYGYTILGLTLGNQHPLRMKILTFYWMLLKANFDARKQKLNKDLPDLICVITGPFAEPKQTETNATESEILPV